MVAKRDELICEVARRYIKRHKEKHLLLVAKRHMRRLARLLICVRKLDNSPTVNMSEILSPNKFKVLVHATKEIAEYDSRERCFKSPSLALQMGTLLKSARENCNRDRLEELKALNILIGTDWADEISSEAGQNLNVNKFNKPTLIPMAEDIKKFEAYLNEILQKAKELLTEDPSDKKAFRDLVDGTFCRVLLFNRRRVGELQRMTLSAYLKNELTASSEFEKALTPTEIILYKSLKRVVIRGKRGRGVPVLFEKSILEYIELLIEHRRNFNLDDNIYLFANPGTNNSITDFNVSDEESDDDNATAREIYVGKELQTNITDSTENDKEGKIAVRARKKRTLIPWTPEQKNITEAFFKKHIKERKPPRKSEVVQMIQRYPEVFQNKTWPVIKVYVCNKFRK
nr:unnamed protein product [Callosobruchus analis]